MTSDLVPVTPPDLLRRGDALLVPPTIAEEGEAAAWRFAEFFTANISNDNTRDAYYRAALRFLDWTRRKGLSLQGIRAPHAGAYFKELERRYSAPTVKQELAAVRQLFDFLVVGQVVASNPLTSVKGPRYSIREGKTPVLSEEEARHLLKSIKVSFVVGEEEVPHLVGLRDRALISVLLYGFARVGAAVRMDVEDY
jgi:site-specific recombinase XerD